MAMGVRCFLELTGWTAGIIAASQDNSIGISGVAPECDIVPINIFAGGETALDVANAINWAWNQGQADVLSNSWSYFTSSQNELNFDAIIQAITNARTLGRNGKGSVVIFSSGNRFAAGLPDVSFPGNLSGVITVGACNNPQPAGDIWYYSQRGSSMDLVAPSGDINLNGDVITLDRMGNAGYSIGNYVSSFGGTSAACPQVSGIAALMLAVNPNLTESQVRTTLQNTATDMGVAGFDNTFGFGRANGCLATSQALASGGISGTTSLCTSIATSYSIPNLPGSVPVSWVAFPTGIVSISTNGNIAVLTKVGSGIVTLTATIQNVCGTQPVIVTKEIVVGVPNQGDLYIYGDGQTVCPNVPIDFGAFYKDYDNCTISGSGATNIEWEISPSPTQIIYNSGMGANCPGVSNSGVEVIFPNQTSNYNVKFRVQNGCGYSSWSNPYLVQVLQGGICGGWGFKISPNPASETMEISLEQESKDNVASNEIKELKIISKSGYVIKQIKYNSKFNKVRIDISNLKSDMYIIQIYNGKEWKSKSFIIR